MRLQCLEEYSSKRDLPMMQLSFQEIVGIAYPSSVRDWKSFVCGVRHFQLRKDLVDVAFLLKQLKGAAAAVADHTAHASVEGTAPSAGYRC